MLRYSLSTPKASFQKLTSLTSIRNVSSTVYDIVISGGGMVGTAAAAALGKFAVFALPEYSCWSERNNEVNHLLESSEDLTDLIFRFNRSFTPTEFLS